MKAFVLGACAFTAVLAGGAAWSQGLTTAQVLAQSRGYNMQIREGRYDLAPQSVALVEEHLKLDPENAELWVAYGTAQFSLVTQAAQPGGNMAALLPAMQKGAQAFDKAASLDAKNVVALAGRGATRTITGSMANKPEMIRAGMKDMDDAVAMAPTDSTPRLQRAFFGVNLPRAIRDDAVIETDLKYLISVGTSREKDVLRLLLGDLYAETGKPELAKAEYLASNRAGSTQTAGAAKRLAAIETGKVDAAEIAGLRGQLGTNCAICHGR